MTEELKVKIGDREIDVTKALPLRVRDMLRLADMGVTRDKLANPDIAEILKIAIVIIQRCAPEIKMAEIEDMNYEDAVKILTQIQTAAGELTRPIETSSTLATSLEGNTAGVRIQ